MRRPYAFSAYSFGFDGSEYTPEETEFLLAMLAFQKRTRRRFPTLSEVLRVAHSLGYRKVVPPIITEPPPIEPTPPGDSPCSSPVS